MIDKIDKTILDEIIIKYHIDKKTASVMRESLNRINAINESKNFRYEPLVEFEKRLVKLNSLKEKATESFRPFANKYHTSLCASMGVPMMESISMSKKSGNYEAFQELFGLTNAKAKRFGLAALYSALEGQKNDIPNTGAIYNIVFDRDSPWTYRNEVEHMEEYARYHFNSYVINEVENSASNPFEPVISLYEYGSVDFIFMQTEYDNVKTEKLCTFHTVNIPNKGNVLAVHMTGDEKLMHYRKWGDPYFIIHPIEGKTKLRVVGIADQRFMVD
ncbi:hypothetical protein [Candidatus Nitrosotalea bavarica]|uniref:hypothetical protein n=1 Tax=Candidatus Nitrosotalea bavarica TaxID=1903277 RepID=UPI000C70CF4B|nr:hypothetical protein [Candidatus Nitrosotalea bavarica]